MRSLWQLARCFAFGDFVEISALEFGAQSHDQQAVVVSVVYDTVGAGNAVGDHLEAAIRHIEPVDPSVKRVGDHERIVLYRNVVQQNRSLHLQGRDEDLLAG